MANFQCSASTEQIHDLSVINSIIKLPAKDPMFSSLSVRYPFCQQDYSKNYIGTDFPRKNAWILKKISTSRQLNPKGLLPEVCTLLRIYQREILFYDNWSLFLVDSRWLFLIF